jgi:para-aminobenzoate synthetase component 2
MIDNYDSFTFNLVQYLEGLKEKVSVYRNDAITLNEVKDLNPSIIVISPGPCTPEETGICKEIIKEFKGKVPILGICLGHQTIAKVFGANIVKASEPVHGKVHAIKHNNIGSFKNLKNPLKVTRYHSLIIEKDTLPNCLTITAETNQGEIMGIIHNEYNIEGIQFHPEAILTECGIELLQNFLNKARDKKVEK